MINSDIIIIGAGITGCAVARELSRYNSSILVLESGSDVAEGATKANSGIIHAGYDAIPGTLKAKFNVLGAEKYPALCSELGVSYQKCGALVIGLNNNDEKTIEELLSRGRKNGVKQLSIISRSEILDLEPNINPDVLCALFAPTSAIVSPYEVAFALADNAAINNVNFDFEKTVISVDKRDDSFVVITENQEYTCKVLINCAGSSGAIIHNQLCEDNLSMIHRRGQYYLLDRTDDQPFNRTIFQCPSKMGKGVLVSPTVHGNLIIGPTAEDIADPLDVATTSDGLAEIIRLAKITWPTLSVRSNITNFSGVRAHLETGDFIVGPVKGISGAYEAVGIESPGLSSAPAIAEYLCKLVVEFLHLSKKEKITTYKLNSKRFRDMSNQERENAIRENPLHGNIICRCEMVTEAEIREAINRPIGARTIDAVKRRSRAGMGRCQGGFCSPRVASIIADETHVSILDVTKNGGHSNILVGTVEDYLNKERNNA